jgi:hypothetical protein
VAAVASLHMGHILPAADAVQVLEAAEPAILVLHKGPAAAHSIANTHHIQAEARDPGSGGVLAEAFHAQNYTCLLSDTVPFAPSVCRACDRRCGGEQGTHPCLAAPGRGGSDMRLLDYSFLAVSNDDKARLGELDCRLALLYGKTNTSLLDYTCPSPNGDRVYQPWTVLAAALPELRVRGPFGLAPEGMGAARTAPRQVLPADGSQSADLSAAVVPLDQILALGIG